jgi:6-pyruvoyltetrahydropterin/6-carboxytetrahydropterin synthase
MSLERLTDGSAVNLLSSKTYTHSVGLSACFRQWRASSHCHYLHGYALQVKLTFGGHNLDDNNWVVDFGSLKEVKKWLEDTFDHKTLVAIDDPQFNTFAELHGKGIIQMVEVESTGCEAFALHVYRHVEKFVNTRYSSRVFLLEVEVREHEANSAIVRNANYGW